MVVTKQTLKVEGGFLVKQSSRPSRFRPVEIGKVDGTRAVLEAVPQEMTAFGGVPMLAEVEKKVGLVRELSKLVHDNRAQHLVDHKKFDILMQRACQIGSGFPDGNDCDWLRRDAAIMLGLDRDPVTGRPGASQETTSRFEGQAIDGANFESVTQIFIDHFMRHHKRRPRRIKLDGDGSKIKTYGAQEGSVYRGGPYKHTIYFPLKIFCGDWLLATILRRGDKSESKTIVTELKKIVAKLRTRWPRVRITVRLDAAFESPELIDWLRKERIGYEMGLRTNSVLKLNAKAFIAEAEEKLLQEHGKPLFIGKDGNKKAQKEHARVRGLPTEKRMEAEKAWKERRVRVVGEFCYKPEKWKNWERVICRVDFTDKGAEVYYILVSCQLGLPKRIYEDEYCQRGLAEQCIGRFKRTGQRLSAQEFYANQFRLIMYGIAYMLLFHLREYAGAEFRRADVETLRKTHMLMPMTVCRTANKITLQISETHVHCREFLHTWRRLIAA
jgi:hypothetical protein